MDHADMFDAIGGEVMPHKEGCYQPLKVTFFLDGTGVHYDPYEPPMLDALIAWGVLPDELKQRDLGRDDLPDFVPLPLKHWQMKGTSGYCASALFPSEEDTALESLIMRRKKFRLQYIDRVDKGSPNITGGPYRENNMPVPLLVTQRLVGWCNGDIDAVRKALKAIKYVGRMRGAGRGKVVRVDVEPTEHDYSLTRGGLAMRHLPKRDGLRKVRMMPPYWNNHDRRPACEILEKFYYEKYEAAEATE